MDLICHKCDTKLGPELESGHRKCPNCLTFWFMHPDGTDEELAAARAEWKEAEKNKPTYGKQVVDILDSLFNGRYWHIEWLVPGRSGGYDHDYMLLDREELLAKPDLLTARKYIKEKEE